jgi:hypothetical protein
MALIRHVRLYSILEILTRRACGACNTAAYEVRRSARMTFYEPAVVRPLMNIAKGQSDLPFVIHIHERLMPNQDHAFGKCPIVVIRVVQNRRHFVALPIVAEVPFSFLRALCFKVVSLNRFLPAELGSDLLILLFELVYPAGVAPNETGSEAHQQRSDSDVFRHVKERSVLICRDRSESAPDPLTNGTEALRQSIRAPSQAVGDSSP